MVRDQLQLRHSFLELENQLKFVEATLSHLLRMKAEIEAAAHFLTQLISQKQPRNIPEDRLNTFRINLVKLLGESFQVKYKGHIKSATLMAPLYLHQ